jgi:hypothetical protein
MQEILVLRVGAIQVLDEAHELYPGKPRQRPLYRSPVLCHDSSPFQFLHGIFSTDIVRKMKSSSQYTGNGPEPTFGASANKISVRPCLWASEATPILFLEFFNAVLLIAVYLAVKGATLVEVEMGYGDDNRIMGVLTVEVEAA